jgi:hypothetical protein
MSASLDRVYLARLPVSALAVLAGLRREAGISVVLEGDRAWVLWEPGAEAVLRRVLPVPGVELFVRREGLWHRHGQHLPAFGLPEALAEGGLPLHRAVVPVPVRAVPPGPEAPRPTRLGLVRDERVRPATALRCSLAELGRWAETATTAEIGALRAARAAERVLVLGARLPALAGGERFWGARVLVPLGFRAEPDLPETALRAALHVTDEALLVLETEGFEAVPRDALRPLSRSSIRLALGGLRP